MIRNPDRHAERLTINSIDTITRIGLLSLLALIATFACSRPAAHALGVAKAGENPNAMCSSPTAVGPVLCSTSQLPSEANFAIQRNATSKSKPDTLIFGTGDYGSSESISDLQNLLIAAGYGVRVAPSLPDDLSSFRAIWFIDAQSSLDASEQTRLKSFVSSGGGLFLTGERPCCEALNQGDQALVNSLVTSGPIQVGGLGDADYCTCTEKVNPLVIDGLATTPNTALQWEPSAPGGLSGVSARNVTTRSAGGLATGAAWGSGDLNGKKGRLVIQMDVNWLEWSYTSKNLNTSFASNIEYFLTKGKYSPPASGAYVNIGDSLTSGEGSFKYLSGSDTKYDKCHRASNGFGIQISTSLKAYYSSYFGAACSGASISDLYNSNGEYSSELPQLVHLSPQTKLVTLAIGVNDIGFSDVLTDCIYDDVGKAVGQPNCFERNGSSVDTFIGYLTTGMPSGPHTLPGVGQNSKPGSIVSDSVSGPQPSLASVYEEILAAAPNAKLVVLGYPNLFGCPDTFLGCATTNDPNGSCLVSHPLFDNFYISNMDIFWLRGVHDELNSSIESAARKAASETGRSVRFVDPTQLFQGHAVCDSGSAWINQLIISGQKPKQESFHPGTTGQDKLAGILSSSIVSNLTN